MSSDAGGTPARGYSWPPFEPGNQAAVKHGAYAIHGLAPRVIELAAVIREAVPGSSPIDEITIENLAIICVRIERAQAAITRVDEAVKEPLQAYVGDRAKEVARLREDLRGWISLALRYSDQLGLSPASRARLGLDVALGLRAMSATITPDRLRAALTSGEISVDEAETFAHVWRVLLGSTAPGTAAIADSRALPVSDVIDVSLPTQEDHP